MKVYIDSDFKCHVTNDGTMTAVEDPFFNGKCDAFVEGHRLVPFDEKWTRSDGAVFTGQMVAPWKDDAILAAYQEQYETTNAELAAAYQEGVNSV